MKRVLLYLLAITGWVTLLIRIYLKITTSGLPLTESLMQLFSYFTVLTNLLVTIYCTVHLLSSSQQSRSKLFLRPETLTALTVFILIVGTVYHLLLKSLWNPEGLLMITDEIYHTFVPLGTLALWLVSADNKGGNLKYLYSWILYPVLYLVFVLIRGSVSGFYPYPFINVAELGLVTVMMNSFFLLILMCLLFLLFGFVGKNIARFR
ncbi:MAG: Pr6Pr family membrane protein [Candidatus Cyclonatronum sp.]|uniref:Pr6Pr family membrane protein n=1 Tax=Cyclonatronum sp. TaxID=3024185 RepID=UPI0025C68632|nr:Pr6Pr family membrane protein [Cyclonatronum sp.]MCH8488127.1 Pr6Pr family membrane protein [Cyclonatronum sp.]